MRPADVEIELLVLAQAQAYRTAKVLGIITDRQDAYYWVRGHDGASQTGMW
jgi:hypothetical protein